MTDALTGPWADLAEPQAIALPSGQRVAIVLPDLLNVAALGEIPSALLDWVHSLSGQADGQAEAPDDGRTDMDRTVEFVGRMRELARVTVVEPALTEAQWRSVPSEDLIMLGQIAMRTVTEDADKQPIRGLQPRAAFREGAQEPDDAAAAADDGGPAQATPERPAGRARSRAGVAAG